MRYWIPGCYIDRAMERGLLYNCILASLFASILFLGIKYGLAPVAQAINPVAHLSTKYDYTDLYYSRFAQNAEVDTSIVLVNIAEADRAALAQGIVTICSERPAVLALDFVLRDFHQSPSDTALARALDSCSKVVMSHYIDRSQDGSHPFFGIHPSGHNLLSTDRQGIVREIMMKDELHGSQAFSQVIGQSYDDDVEPCAERVLINPHSTYRNFLYGELLGSTPVSEKHNLRGKIVMLGYAGSGWAAKSGLEDRHYFASELDITRVHPPKTEGVVIHAVALANLLSSNFIKQVPAWLSSLLAFFVLCVCNYYYFRHFKSWSISFFLRCRAFQLLVLIVLIVLAYLLLHWFGWKFDFLTLLVAPVISLDFASLYISLLKKLNKYIDLSHNYVIKKS